MVTILRKPFNSQSVLTAIFGSFPDRKEQFTVPLFQETVLPITATAVNLASNFDQCKQNTSQGN